MYKLQVGLIALMLSFTGVVSATHLNEATVKERTKPNGKVYRQGDDVPVAKAAVVETSGPRSGETVYTENCSACHGAGIAGAPKVGDQAAWTDRITQDQSVIYEHAIKGYQGSAGFMPAKGGCAACTDEEVKSAVDHMLSLLK